MPAKLDWTPAQDAELVSLRERKVPWNDCARLMQRSRNTVMDRARLLGVVKRPSVIGAAVPPANAPRQVLPVVVTDHLEFQVYPPGHPATWGLLLSLTPSLAGARYG